MFILPLFWVLPRIFPRFLLFLLGWGPPPTEYINVQKRKYKNVIFIFSHTSYWDFWLIILYKLGYPECMVNIYTVMKPQAFKAWYGFWLPWCGFIPTTRLEDASDGFIDRTVTLMQSFRECHLLIAPKGMMNLNQWRSGYYHLAKKIKGAICVTGLDLEKRQLLIMEGHLTDDYNSYQDMEQTLQAEMGQIIPLYINCVPYKLRSYDSNKLSFWGPTNITYISIIVLTSLQMFLIYDQLYYISLVLIRQLILWYDLDTRLTFNHYMINVFLEYLLLLRLMPRLSGRLIGYMLVANYVLSINICYHIWKRTSSNIIEDHKIILLCQLFSLLYAFG